MSNDDRKITPHLPALRRYSRCLTGSQTRGDQHVRACLEAILIEPALLGEFADPRVGLFRAYHDLLIGLLDPHGPEPTGPVAGARKLERHIHALPAVEREVLLLRTLCEFSCAEIAEILRISSTAAEEYLARAREDLKGQTATRVLIIEDESVIAFDLAGIVSEMGHHVAGIADTRLRAVALARKTSPGIVLADIKLRDGSSGIDAVEDILGLTDVPVIFVTAYPERLLTGERREPTYLVTKPFEPEALEVTISQALLLHPAAPKLAAG